MGKNRKSSEEFSNACTIAIDTVFLNLSLPFSTRYILLSDARFHLSRKQWPVPSPKQMLNATNLMQIKEDKDL